MAMAMIPARGGSKRIPGKNIKLFNGKPIIAYSIEAAIACGCFERIIVSTDDSDIAREAISCGAEVPFIRPASLADDYATTFDVIKHTLHWLDERGECPEFLCTLYATAPFLEADSIQKAFQLLQQDSAKQYCFAVAEYPSPIQRAFRISAAGEIEMFSPEYFLSRSQDLERAYFGAGQFYWGRSRAFMEDVPLYSTASIPYLLPNYKVQDIDTPDDWLRAEAMYRALKSIEAEPGGSEN
ncbi:pseudaminic acid cytidylyltransferase [Shewanella sedimentimangrovi]|uniref:Pseudaminic acid cytidylyltransferase n=1 Tax=Shewanella sedimentimangrovi TaxID=2814293 RepID=A0ABX7QZ42_9GAMM|nr:pseudaminic acid cytidylyltransferase [Shewanella sedimentimangrovi]QSX36120.1 pseudaminic acid cytidylyltransferase [Shewanella sedimentimangrovi]